MRAPAAVAIILLALSAPGLLYTQQSADGDTSRPDAGGGGVTTTVVRRQGDDSVNTYRIPGLATTPGGTLIAVFDIRRKGARDLPADIDVGTMRSTDNGRTWSPMNVALDFDSKEEGSLGNGVGDPAVLVDQRTGRIIVAALWSKGDRGWQGSGPGLSVRAPEHDGEDRRPRPDVEALFYGPREGGAVNGRHARFRRAVP
jgi:hypothetical protein